MNKDFNLQNFKAGAARASKILKEKGHEIPKTTLLHTLSHFVDGKDWNTMQALLKNENNNIFDIKGKEFENIVSLKDSPYINKKAYTVDNFKDILIQTIKHVKSNGNINNVRMAKAIFTRVIEDWDKVLSTTISDILIKDNKVLYYCDENSVEVSFYRQEVFNIIVKIYQYIKTTYSLPFYLKISESERQENKFEAKGLYEFSTQYLYTRRINAIYSLETNNKEIEIMDALFSNFNRCHENHLPLKELHF